MVIMDGYGFHLNLKYEILRIGKEKIVVHRLEDAPVRAVMAKDTDIQSCSKAL